jgi:hypothetical protein
MQRVALVEQELPPPWNTWVQPRCSVVHVAQSFVVFCRSLFVFLNRRTDNKIVNQKDLNRRTDNKIVNQKDLNRRTDNKIFNQKDLNRRTDNV